MRAFGIDLSPRTATGYTWQANHDFVIVGVSDGLYKLPNREGLLEEACKAPVTLAYHYLRYDKHWKDQIATFLDACGFYEIDAYCIDFEKANNVPSSEFAYMSKLVIDKITTDTGKRCLLYSSPSVVQEWMFHYEEYYIRRGNYFMWCAQYPYEGYNSAMDNVTDPNSGWEPRLPAGVTDWKFWQYSADGNDKASENGIEGNPDVDLDVFNGSLEDLKTWLRMEEPPPANCDELIAEAIETVSAGFLEQIAVLNRVHEEELEETVINANNSALEKLIKPYLL